jgi:tRNA modification GTPase
MLPGRDDTIAAIATPPGDGAIAVVRLSGPDALAITDHVFRGSTPLATAAGYTVHPGHLLHPSGTILDRVLVTVFRSPHSYTGEDSTEISCHGGRYLTGRILESVLGAGARAAHPGEFTRRAFMNRKLDLTQAEAVADLIAARSERSHRISVEQLQGRLGERIRGLRSALIELCSLMELELDFTEEGIQLIANEEIRKRIKNVADEISNMVISYESGKVIHEGISVAIIGQPNVGKSSIFNALLEHDRAIVTHIAGTTRDTLEEAIVLGGVYFRLTDTAGLRLSSDLVEQLGVDRSLKSVTGADLVLLVYDNESEHPSLLPELEELDRRHRLVVVRNKVDLLPSLPADKPGKNPPEVHVSAKSGYGIETLKSMLASMVGPEHAGDSSQIITRERHRAALVKALESLDASDAALNCGTSGEFVALDLRAAADSLGEITGEITSEEILNSLFASFCVGK